MSRRRFLRALVALVLGVLFAFVLAELALRWALFSDGELARSIGRRVRTPDAFGTADLTEEYWRLQRRFTPRDRLAPAPGPDPVLGWHGDVIDPSTNRNYEAEPVGTKRPVLLYGDSFAQGVVAREARFQGLMEASALGTRFALLNHGVGGYGVDQAYLMFERTLDVWKDARPVVVFSIFVDSDLDRAGLAFRGWPKPRLELDGRELVVHAPATLDPDRWFEEEFSPWRSWLVSLATYRAGIVPERVRAFLVERDARIAEKAALTERILAAVHARCVEREVEHCVLLFHAAPGIPRVPWTTWQVPCVERACASAGMRLVDTRPYFEALEAQCGDAVASWYIAEGGGMGHLNEAGNRVAFEALADEIEGRPCSEGIARVVALRRSGALDPSAMRTLERELLGRAAHVRSRPLLGCVRSGKDLAEWLGAPGEPVLALRASDGVEPIGASAKVATPAGGANAAAPSTNASSTMPAAITNVATEVEFPLDAGPLRFRAITHAAQRPDEGCGASAITLVALLDGRELARWVLSPSEPEHALDLDLAGGTRFVLRVERPTGRAACTWVVLRAPRFE